MRKVGLLLIVCAWASSILAVEKVEWPSSFVDGWDKYIGKMVQITTPLYVCGNYYDSLILATERLYVPEEHAVGLADGDSTAYWAIKKSNREKMISLSCNIRNYEVRTGAVVKNLQARVVAPGKLVTGATPKFINNKPEPKPKMLKGGLLICAANIQNYFYDLGGYAQRKTTKEQQTLQTLKICKAFKQINADIYALCEIQKGDSAAQMLVDDMNKMAKKNLYAYVSHGWTNSDMISCGYIYRTDKVKPYGEMQYAYQDTTSHYRYRLMACGFEEIASGERFVLNINHLRSKRGTGAESNEKRMANVDSLLVMLDKIEQEQVFGDSDILLVGDYNSYTQEEPIQTLVRAGYADMVMRDDSTGYSYVYHSEAGYLDRVFASESMAKQVKQVAVYHLNADYFYSRGFKRGLDDTMFRYADHDPIFIRVELSAAL
jgi:predicted extracellular nuclease